MQPAPQLDTDSENLRHDKYMRETIPTRDGWRPKSRHMRNKQEKKKPEKTKNNHIKKEKKRQKHNKTTPKIKKK